MLTVADAMKPNADVEDLRGGRGGAPGRLVRPNTELIRQWREELRENQDVRGLAGFPQIQLTETGIKALSCPSAFLSVRLILTINQHHCADVR